MKPTLLLAYVFEFLRDGFYLGIFLLLPFLAKDIHLTLFQAGSLQTIVNVLIVALSIPTVTLLIKFGEVRMLLFSLLLYALGFLLFFFAGSYAFLVVIFILMGIAFGFYATISAHIGITWFDEETRGKELGNLMAVGDVAKIIFSVLIGLGAGLIGWRLTSVGLGLSTGIIFLLFCLIFLQKPSTKHVVTQKEQEEHHPYLYFFKQKRFVWSLITSSLDQGINAPFYSFLPFLLLYKGVPLSFIGAFAAIYYIGNTISRLIFGRLVDRLGSARVLIMLEVAMAIVTFSIASVTSIVFIGILALILGLLTEGTDPASAAMGAESLSHIAHPEKASGIRSLGNGIGKALFPFLLGLLASSFGIIWGFYILALACLIPIIPAVLFLRSKESTL